MFKSAFIVSFFIALSRIFGFVRDILIAQFLGAGMLSDVFFAAFRLPNFFRRVFGEGALNSAFVPIFVELNGKKDGSDLRFARNIFSLLFYVLLLLILLLQIAMPLVMSGFFPGFLKDPEKFSLLVDLSRVTIFYLLFISLVALCSSVLNSLGKFAVPSSSPIILNLTFIFALFAFGDLVPNYAYALAWGLFLAGVLQLSYLLFFTCRAGFLLYPKLTLFSCLRAQNVKKFFKKFLPGVVGANVMQINLLVDSIFASMMGGALSYLYYADRVNQLPLAMIGIALGVALLPTMSRKIKENDAKEAIRLQNLAIEVGLAFVLPAALALFCLAFPIISTLFERGEFTGQESLLVSQALRIYACGLPAYVLVKVVEPGFFARGDTKFPMKVAFLCLFSNIIFNLVFFHCGFGFKGVAASSVLSSYLNLLVLLIVLIKRGDFVFEGDFLAKLARVLIPALFMGAVLLILRDYFAQNSDFSLVFELAVMVFVGLVVYFGACFASGAWRFFKKSRGIF